MDQRIDLERHAAKPGPISQGAAGAAVVKKLAAGAAGTQHLLARFGEALVACAIARKHRGAAIPRSNWWWTNAPANPQFPRCGSATRKPPCGNRSWRLAEHGMHWENSGTCRNPLYGNWVCKTGSCRKMPRTGNRGMPEYGYLFPVLATNG